MAGHTDPTGLRVESAWPAWLLPIGWGQQMRPFGGDHWVLGDPAGQTGHLIVASLVQLPGILVIGAAVITAVGLVPRFAGVVSWALLLTFILVGPLFGPTLKLPQWAQDLSPFTHVPKAPAVAVTAWPVLSLIAVVAALAVAGLVSLRRRDLALPA
jgi:ABC-2 type transport system permease protein